MRITNPADPGYGRSRNRPGGYDGPVHGADPTGEVDTGGGGLPDGPPEESASDTPPSLTNPDFSSVFAPKANFWGLQGNTRFGNGYGGYGMFSPTAQLLQMLEQQRMQQMMQFYLPFLSAFVPRGFR